MMSAYYNENDPFAAAWLRNLIAENLIALGEVDERDIRDVRPSDLVGFNQCHFFAGIGGWSLALRLAGVPDDFRCWTGSCPCQPFSAAGKGGGFNDERHLWPDWFWLVRDSKPSVIFGEQVASAAVLPWVGLVQADLEGAGYAFGASDLCAAGIGAPHIRQRLWWVADSNSETQSGRRIQRSGQGDGASVGASCKRPAGLRSDGLVVDADHEGPQGRAGVSERPAQLAAGTTGVAVGVADAASVGREMALFNNTSRRTTTEIGQANVLGGDSAFNRPGPTNGVWRDADWLCCRDGKWRPVEPGTFPLAHGVSGRVGRLRAYGNAIVPPLAAEFIKAALDL